MDFTLPPPLEDVRLRTRRFVEDHILPLEADPASYDAHENIAPAVLAGCKRRRRPPASGRRRCPPSHGGMGLPMIGQAAMYEEANRSIFGPVCFNAAAPDDGNMRLLSQVATPARRSAGSIRSPAAPCAPPSR